MIMKHLCGKPSHSCIKGSLVIHKLIMTFMKDERVAWVRATPLRAGESDNLFNKPNFEGHRPGY